MASSVAATIQMNLSVNETLDPTLTPDAASGAVITHNALNLSKQLKATSSPAATTTVAKSGALSGGAASIDLTSLSGTNGQAVNATGLHVRAVMLVAPATNAAAITFKYGASNPYNMLGASWSVTLNPGDQVMAYLGAAPAVASGAKQIDISGTGTDAYKYQLLLG